MVPREVILYTTPLQMVSKAKLGKIEIREFKHWAICVGDRCYEVARVPGGSDTHDFFERSKDEWIQSVIKDRKGRYTKEDLGKSMTTWPDDMIKKCAENIWQSLFNRTFNDYIQNCQEFCFWLLHCIVSNFQDKTIKDRFEGWDPDVLVPSWTAGAGAGFVAGYMAGGGVVDLFITGGTATVAVGTVGLSVYFAQRYRRRRKGFKLVKTWRERMS